MRARAVFGLAFLCYATAVSPVAIGASEFVVEDPMERTVREIALQLRCPVCQGENLYDSQSSLAAEMRAIIREQLAANRTESEIIAYFVERYGNYVRLAPGLDGGHLVVWLIPLAAFAVGAAGVTFTIRQRQRASSGTKQP